MGEVWQNVAKNCCMFPFVFQRFCVLLLFFQLSQFPAALSSGKADCPPQHDQHFLDIVPMVLPR